MQRGILNKYIEFSILFHIYALLQRRIIKFMYTGIYFKMYEGFKNLHNPKLSKLKYTGMKIPVFLFIFKIYWELSG